MGLHKCIYIYFFKIITLGNERNGPSGIAQVRIYIFLEAMASLVVTFSLSQSLSHSVTFLQGKPFLLGRKKKNGPSGNAQVCFINPFINLRDWVRVIVTFY